MPKSTTRRGFINTLVFVTAVPSNFGIKPLYTASSTTPNKYTFKTLKPVDGQFVSVDGWIIPNKTLTRGAV
jgi:hypothetical protein